MEDVGDGIFGGWKQILNVDILAQNENNSYEICWEIQNLFWHLAELELLEGFGHFPQVNRLSNTILHYLSYFIGSLLTSFCMDVIR